MSTEWRCLPSVSRSAESPTRRPRPSGTGTANLLAGRVTTGGGQLGATQRSTLEDQLRLNPTKVPFLQMERVAVAWETHPDDKFLSRSSEPTLGANKIALGSKQLLRVERGWRNMKTTLDPNPVSRPIEERIRSCAVLSWLTLALTPVGDRRTHHNWRDLRQRL